MAGTGSSAYIEYGLETSFQGGATFTRAFRMEQKVTGLVFRNNIIPIPELYTTEIKAFAHGKNEGAATLEWTVSNPWFFDLLFDNANSTIGTPDTHEWSSDPDEAGWVNTGVRQYKTANLEIAFAGETANEVRSALGAIAPSITLRTTVNETVKASMPLIWGKESAIGTTLDTTVAGDDILFPYTFAHATLELPNGTPIAQIQDFEITIDPSGELIWGVGSPDAAAPSGKKIINITGRFRKAKVDAVALQQVVDRTEVATLEIVLTNGLTGGNERSITLLGTGVGISENTTDYVPGEIVFEDLIWQIRSLKVTAKNNTAAAP